MPLQQFIGNSGRLLLAWQQPDDVASVLSRPGVEAEIAILPAFVSMVVDIIVKVLSSRHPAFTRAMKSRGFELPIFHLLLAEESKPPPHHK